MEYGIWEEERYGIWEESFLSSYIIHTSTHPHSNIDALVCYFRFLPHDPHKTSGGWLNLVFPLLVMHEPIEDISQAGAMECRARHHSPRVISDVVEV
jgi:hypothetical protein